MRSLGRFQRTPVEVAIVGIDSLPFVSAIPGGIVTLDHLGFRINATGGPDPRISSPAMCVGAAPTVASFSLGPIGSILALLSMGVYATLSGHSRDRRKSPTGGS